MAKIQQLCERGLRAEQQALAVTKRLVKNREDVRHAWLAGREGQHLC